MDKHLSPTSDNQPAPDETINMQRAFWVAIIFTTIAVISFGVGIFLTVTQPYWQIYAMLVIAAFSVVFDILAVVLIKRGRAGTGIKILYWSGIITLPLNNLLFPGVMPVLVVIILVMGFVNIYLLFPRAWRKYAPFGSIAAALFTLLVDYLNPPFRFSAGVLPTASFFGPAILVFLVIGILVLVLRQAILGNLRTKLIIAFVVVTFLVGGITGTTSSLSFRTSLTEEIGNKLADQAGSRGIEVATSIDREKDILSTLALNVSLLNAAKVANETSQLSQAEIDRLDRQWQAADASNNNADPLVSGVLNNEISVQLRDFRSQFVEHVEVFLTGVQGVSIASTNRTSDYNQADEEWWQIAYRDGIYIGQPEFDSSSKTIAMNMAVAVRDNGDGNIVGVLRTTVNFTTLANTLETGMFGQSGRTIILLPSGQELRLNAVGDGTYELVEEPALPELVALSQPASRYQSVSLNNTPSLVSVANVHPVGDTEEDTLAVSNLDWRVVTLQDEAEALQPVTAQTRNILIVGIIIMLAAIITAVGLARAISGPVIRLNATAQKVAAGDLAVQAKVETLDEVGTLATTFNGMVTQLRDLIASLEARVAARTADLATVAEVGTATATILETEQLLQSVVDLTKERFKLYHSHIYLLDPAGENLVLASGAGEPGRQMKAKGLSIPLNREQSLVARAARERKGVTVNDVTEAPDFLPNPLLPDTRSELAVPMIVGGNVIGVFDVQSDQVGRFTDSDISIQTTLAAQVATSIQNVRSFEQSKSQAELESLVNAIGQKIQRSTSMEDTLQIAIREIGLALGAQRVKASIGRHSNNDRGLNE